MLKDTVEDEKDDKDVTDDMDKILVPSKDMVLLELDERSFHHHTHYCSGHFHYSAVQEIADLFLFSARCRHLHSALARSSTRGAQLGMIDD